jgi:hypothetical protein
MKKIIKPKTQYEIDKKKLSKEQFYKKYQKPITLKEYLLVSKGYFIGVICAISVFVGIFSIIGKYFTLGGICFILSIVLFVMNNIKFYTYYDRKELYEYMYEKPSKLIFIEFLLLIWSMFTIYIILYSISYLTNTISTLENAGKITSCIFGLIIGFIFMVVNIGFFINFSTCD